MGEFTIERDTAIFGPQQWVVEHPNLGRRGAWYFSTEQDAKNAVILANWSSGQGREEIAQKVREAVDGY